MLLKIKGKGSVISLDSSMDGFDHIVLRALAAARENGVVLEPGTLSNLPAMGIEVTPDMDETTTGSR